MSSIAVELELENRTNQTQWISPYFARLKEPEGPERVTSLQDCGQPLLAQRLAPGDKVKGTVAFDAPTGARSLVLLYAPVFDRPHVEVSRIEFER